MQRRDMDDFVVSFKHRAALAEDQATDQGSSFHLEGSLDVDQTAYLIGIHVEFVTVGLAVVRRTRRIEIAVQEEFRQAQKERAERVVVLIYLISKEG